MSRRSNRRPLARRETLAQPLGWPQAAGACMPRLKRKFRCALDFISEWSAEPAKFDAFLLKLDLELALQRTRAST